MEIKLYWQMIRKGWWIVLLTALVAVNVALVTNYFSTPIYRATSNYLVSPNPQQLPATDMVYSLDALGNRSTVVTYSELLRNEMVISETIKQLNLDPTELVKDYKISSLVLTETTIIELSVEGPDPKLCALLVNTLGQNGVSYIQRFYKVYEINLIKPATVPQYPYLPKPLRDISLALILGIIAGAVLAILSEQIRIPLETLRQQRLLDSLSGVYTRQHFERLVEEEMLRARKQGDVFALGLVRLDGLVEVIDNLPIIVLQKIYGTVTKSLRSLLKGTDVVGQLDRTTYAVLLPSTPYGAANNVMQRICTMLSVPVELFQGGELLNLSPYAGVARSQESEPPRDFISRTQKDLDDGRFNFNPSPTAYSTSSGISENSGPRSS